MQEAVNGFTRGKWKWTSGEAHNLTCQKMNGEELDIILGTETAQQRANTRLVVATPLLYKQLKDFVACSNQDGECKICPNTSFYETEEDAIDAWNARVGCGERK